MTSPFNKNRISGFLKGLEVSIIAKNDLPNDLRLDPQFFQDMHIAQERSLNNCPTSRIGEFAFVTDGPHGYHEVDEQSQIAMLTAKSASNWFAERVGADRIAQWVDDTNKRSSLEVNDIILSTRGTVGYCALVTEEALPANLDQDVARIVINEDSSIQAAYMLAYLNSKLGQQYMLRHASGMVQQGLSLAKVRDIPIPIFSDFFQEKISLIIEKAKQCRREMAASQKEADELLLSQLGPIDWEPSEPLCYTANADTIMTSARFDAQYFMPAKEQVMQTLAAMPGRQLRGRADSIRDKFEPGQAEKDLMVRNYDVSDALLPVLDLEKEPEFASEIGSTKKVLCNGDVVISRIGAYLQEIAVVRTGGNTPSVGSSEFIVLRLNDNSSKISPETLMVFLRSTPVQTILKWCQDGSQRPRFNERDLLSIHLPDAVIGVSKKITKTVQGGFAARMRARSLLEKAKRAVEIAVEDGEPTATAFLHQQETTLES